MYKVPDCDQRAFNYISGVLLGDFLGIDIRRYEVKLNESSIVIGRDSRTLTLNNKFFRKISTSYLSRESLPDQPLQTFDPAVLPNGESLQAGDVPVIYGEKKAIIDVHDVILGLDIFGSCFFMLSRYEEWIGTERDRHDRFPANASLAYQEGFLEKPVVDIYVEILWLCISYLWKDEKRKEFTFSQHISCDVDWPYTPAYSNIPRLFKRSVKNLLFSRSLSSFKKDIRAYTKIRKGDMTVDPFYTFDFMLDVIEESGEKGTFFFIADTPLGKIDGIYSLSEKVIVDTMTNIHSRGHEIGLHPSYGTYKNKSQLSKEKENLTEALSKINVSGQIPTRQHYLRLDVTETLRNLSEVGFSYDSSLGFPDHIGFRCGTSKKFLLYDVLNCEPLQLKEVPLIIMEVSMLHEHYMGLSYEQALERAMKLKQECRRYNGTFTFLWHNSNFTKEAEKDLFKEIILS